MPNPVLIATAGLGLLFFAVLAAIVAVQAQRRGYRVLVWLVAGAFGNPIFFLVMLAAMPDFARKALRRKYLTELEAKLAARPKVLPPGPPPPPPRPAAAPGSTAPVERSLGDRPTELPPDISLGDAETHL
jgi:hypothetical protein